MNPRALVSLSITAAFLGMALTGGLSYVSKYDARLSDFHVVFSLVFVLLALFHISNNFKPLRNYLVQGRPGLLLGILGGVLGLVLGVAYSLPPFRQIVEFGRELRSRDEVRKKVEWVLTTRSEALGEPLVIDFRAGPEYTSETKLPDGRVIRSIPQVAVWIEDGEGTYLETLFVSGKAGSGGYSGGKNRRPGALPVWSHARGVRAADGLFMPDANSSLPDAVTAATPLTSFSVHSKVLGRPGLRVMIEINKSFDSNDFFNKETFAHDPVYVKNPNGQPSLVYRADLDEGPSLVLAKLLGHGHISGGDGKIDPDLSRMTTALEIFKGIVVETE